MKTTVRQWGNSASVRIPASVMQAADLKLDQAVDIRELDGKVVIEPIRPREESLEDMVARITPENRHGEIDFGSPEGREVW